MPPRGPSTHRRPVRQRVPRRRNPQNPSQSGGDPHAATIRHPQDLPILLDVLLLYCGPILEGAIVAKRTGRVGETFFSRQVRVLLRADFRRGETISIGGGTASLGDQTLAGYLRGRRTERFFDRVFTLGLAVILLIGSSLNEGALIGAQPPLRWSMDIEMSA